MLEQDSEAAKAFGERIDVILQQALLPRAREDLVAHAMRGALLGIADRIGAAAEQAVLVASQEQPSTGAEGSRASATATGATDAAGVLFLLLCVASYMCFFVPLALSCMGCRHRSLCQRQDDRFPGCRQGWHWGC